MQLASLFGVYALSLLAVLLFAAPAAIFAPQQPRASRGAGNGGACRTSRASARAWLWVGRAQARRGRDRPAPVRACASSRPISTKPRNGAPRTAPRSSPTISISPRRGGLDGIDHRDLAGDRGPLPPRRRARSAFRHRRRAAGGKLAPGRDRRGSSKSGTRKARSSRNRIYNSLLVIDDEGRVIGNYDKIHLVPLGEYLPFQDFLESLGMMQLTGVRGGFSVGAGPRLLSVPGAPPASPLICYEIIFPPRGHRERDAAGLAAQHHQRCVVRIERGALSALPSGASPRRSSRACRSCAPPIPASRR